MKLNFPRFRTAALLLLCSMVFPLSAADSTGEIRSAYPVPPKVDGAKLAQRPQTGTPRNIILIIGDGMGREVLNLASLYACGEPGRLPIDQFPVHGLVRTASANSRVTDSAASGTALAGGYKTNNGMIGKTPDKVSRKSFAILARDAGKSIGILTTDALTGATPAAFLAHADHRSQSETIASDIAASRSMILIGSDPKPFLPKKEGGRRTDGRNLLAELRRAGYREAATPEALKNLPAGTPAYGFLSDWSSTDLLSRFAASAFEKLNASANGFFLMIEGHFPDKGGHANNPDLSLNGALMNHFLAKAALDFAWNHPDTLVVVTADHETGGVSVAANKANLRKPHLLYTTKNHTGTPVGVYAFGPGSARFNAILENTDLPRIFAEFWNIKLDLPKQEIPPKS